MNSSPPTGRFDVVVPAAGYQIRPLYPGQRPGYKALLKVHGVRLIDHALRALRQSSLAGEVIVVGPPSVRQAVSTHPGVRTIAARTSLVQNLRLGIEAASTDRVLICNSDQPLLRGDIIDDFLREAAQVDADLVTSWVRFESLGPRHSLLARKFAPFGDGRYCHGNLFLIRRRLLTRRDIIRRIEALYNARKNNLRFAMALGPVNLARFLWALWTGRLPSLEETARIVSRDFDLSIFPLVSPHPELIIDVDEACDLDAIQSFGPDPKPADPPDGPLPG